MKDEKEFLFQPLHQELASYLNEESLAEVTRAYTMASQAHAGQRRVSGDPFISHPIAVAQILASMRMDHQTIMAALLHDVIEDSSVNKETLINSFGNDVAELVDGVSKLKQIKFETQAEAQAENFRKMLLAMAKDIRVILIKLADRLHNMRTLHSMPEEKRKRIANETLEIYAPIANRLGMHTFRVEFEDLSFMVLYPVRFRVLKNAVQKARGYRKEIIDEIKNALKKSLETHGISASSVIGRQKHLYSIYKKMQQRHLSFNEIMDVYGFRIVVKDVETCYRALGAVHSLYKPLFERFKDYIAIPKANGYQSLHTTLFGPYGVPIEIQVRTMEMDYLADNGIASHWIYKSTEGKITEAELHAREWLKDLIDLQKGVWNPVEFIENVKIDLFPDEVYVFTPAGKILELPAGATPIDFAYAIHSDIGNSCVAVKIDRRLAPLSRSLLNGQTVEIITAPGANPNPAWLNFVVTGKAQHAIRHFVKTQKRAESITLGKQLVANALGAFDMVWEKLTRKSVNAVLKILQYKTIDDLCAAVGLGEQLPLAVAQRLIGQTKTTEQQTQTVGVVPLLIKGAEDSVIHFAACCRPIPGDPIMGVIQPGMGVTIHMEDCDKGIAASAMSGQQVPAQWEENVPGEYRVDIQVEIANQPGALARLAAAIAEAEANIDNISLTQQDEQYCQLNLSVSVRSRKHLAGVFRKIRARSKATKLSRSRSS